MQSMHVDEAIKSLSLLTATKRRSFALTDTNIRGIDAHASMHTFSLEIITRDESMELRVYVTTSCPLDLHEKLIRSLLSKEESVLSVRFSMHTVTLGTALYMARLCG